MLDKIFGKKAAIASAVAIFIVGGLTASHVIDSATGLIILTMLGVHASVSDSAVK